VPDKKAPGQPVQEEEEVTVVINYPKAEDHVNREIKEFLEHFASSRKILIDPKAAPFRKRDEPEKK